MQQTETKGKNKENGIPPAKPGYRLVIIPCMNSTTFEDERRCLWKDMNTKYGLITAEHDEILQIGRFVFYDASNVPPHMRTHAHQFSFPGTWGSVAHIVKNEDF